MDGQHQGGVVTGGHAWSPCAEGGGWGSVVVGDHGCSLCREEGQDGDELGLHMNTTPHVALTALSMAHKKCKRGRPAECAAQTAMMQLSCECAQRSRDHHRSLLTTSTSLLQTPPPPRTCPLASGPLHLHPFALAPLL